MKRNIRNILALTFIFNAVQANAYEETTHEILTRYAVMQSNLYKDASLLNDLGLNIAGPYKTSEGSVGDLATITALGARIEDHGSIRSVFHFFDPQYNNFQGRGLQLPYPSSIPGLGNVIMPSTDWSLEDRGEVQGAPTYPQEFSYRNGQHNFFQALTGATATDRQTAASLMFQTLGNVVHHLQDMGQPQHVRNDQHLHWDGFLNDTNWSFYERYTATLEKTKLPIYICGASPVAPDQCVTDYPVRAPYFPTARQYWHTVGTTTARFIGMAEFTAQNYVSYGTSYSTPAFGGSTAVKNNSDFPLPNGFNRDGSSKKEVIRNVSVTLVDGSSFNGNMTFLEGSVYDEYLNAIIPYKKLASPSFLNNWYLTKGMWKKVFTENTRTYDDAYSILLPRAVAFSTGLINNFFRGRIDLRKTSTANGWQIVNTSSYPMNGSFSVYAEDRSSTRKSIYPEFPYQLSAGQAVSIDITMPTDGVTKLIAVFRGKIGDDGDPSLASGYWTTAGKVISHNVPPEPEIVIVGASAINNLANSRRAFRWSSIMGVKNLGIGTGALTTEAFGVSANGRVVVGISTGPKTVGCESCTNPWNGSNQGSFSTLVDIATAWRDGNSPYYLNGGAGTYSAAWTANADGSQIYGEGFVPMYNAVRSITWSGLTPTVHTTVGVFQKNSLTSADGSITLTKVGMRAAYIKNGVTTIIPLPSNHDWSEARHVVLIPR